MIKLTAAILLWGIVASGASPTWAEGEAVQFVAPRISGNLETNKTGLLVELHRYLMRAAGIEDQLKVLSEARALLLMESGAVDGYYPSWVPNNFKVDVLYSAPLMRVEFYIFTAPNAPVISTLAGLAGKRVGLLEGYRLQLPLAEVPGLYVSHAVNGMALYTMLESGRLDAVIMSKNEVMFLCDRRELPLLSYDAKAILAHKYLGYSFLNNSKGVRLQRQVNAAIYRLQQSGDLAQAFPSLTPFLQ